MEQTMSYKLNYWNVPGRGESIRVLLALGGIRFENNFVPLPLPLENPENQNPPPFDDGTWGKLKPQTPWGTLPTLLLPSGEIIGQQRAILRYLGKLIKFEDNYLYQIFQTNALEFNLNNTYTQVDT